MSHAAAGNGLERKLGLASVTSIVVANMIGAGIFTTTGLLMQNLRDPLVLIALWIAGGLIALCGALCYGELGAAIPRAGGEYAFLSRLFHPILGFLTGWVSFFAGFSAPIAASAIGFTEYLARAFPDVLSAGAADGTSVWLGAPVLKKACAILVIGVFTAIHSAGLKVGARVQNVLTALKVGLIACLVILGFAFGDGSSEHFSRAEPFSFDFAGWKTLGLSLMWIMFAYSGWNAAAYIGSEIRNPSRNLPRSLIMGTGIVAALYLLLNLLYVYAVPSDEMAGVISIGGLAVANLFGARFEAVLSVLISFALFSSLSAYIILGPRVYYSMARDRCFFRFAGKVHPRSGVPSKSIVLQGAVAALMVLLGSFDQILTYMGFALGLFPILAVIGLFRLRRQGTAPFRTPGFPAVPAVYILTGAAILVLSYLERPLESSIALLTVAAGIPAYLAFKARYREKQPAP